MPTGFGLPVRWQQSRLMPTKQNQSYLLSILGQRLASFLSMSILFWTHSSLLWRLSILLLFHIVCSHASNTCQADGTCPNEDAISADPEPLNKQKSDSGLLQMEVINESDYRADIYFDDKWLGRRVATVDARGGTDIVDGLDGHSFFVTRHGVREGLVNLETDEQYKFTVKVQEETRVFRIPKDAAPSPNMCQDRYSMCPREAQRGECWVNPGWMIVHCCKSCNQQGMDAEKLIDPTVRCSKQHLNITTPTWKPGDLHDLFVSWATKQEFQNFQPRVLSSPQPDVYGGQLHPSSTANKRAATHLPPPWVIVFDNFLSDEEADALIAGGEMVGFQRSTDQGKINKLGEQERVVSKTRTSSNAWCIGECESLPHIQAVTERIENVTRIPRTHYENFQILRYDNNQFYRKHHDTSNQSALKVAGPRILTFFLYLSDVPEGGETYFNELGISVEARKGRALVWPSVRNDDPSRWDQRMYHEAKPVITE